MRQGAVAAAAAAILKNKNDDRAGRVCVGTDDDWLEVGLLHNQKNDALKRGSKKKHTENTIFFFELPPFQTSAFFDPEKVVVGDKPKGAFAAGSNYTAFNFCFESFARFCVGVVTQQKKNVGGLFAHDMLNFFSSHTSIIHTGHQLRRSRYATFTLAASPQAQATIATSDPIARRAMQRGN